MSLFLFILLYCVLGRTRWERLIRCLFQTFPSLLLLTWNLFLPSRIYLWMTFSSPFTLNVFQYYHGLMQLLLHTEKVIIIIFCFYCSFFLLLTHSKESVHGATRLRLIVWLLWSNPSVISKTTGLGSDKGFFWYAFFVPWSKYRGGLRCRGFVNVVFSCCLDLFLSPYSFLNLGRIIKSSLVRFLKVTIL